MTRQDKIFTISIMCLAGLISLLALPQTTTHIEAEQTTVHKNYFEPLTLQAKAAYVLDLSSNRTLFAKNETDSLPLASLTKIMTTITAADLAPQSTIVTVDPASLTSVGDTGLYANEQWLLPKLLQYTLVASSNDGAAAVASSLGFLARKDSYTDSTQAFVEAMNAKADMLGLSSLHFSNPSGLDISSQVAGAYGSAHDVAELLSYALKHDPAIIEPTRYASFETTSLDNIHHKAINTDIITNQIPGLIAGKTGYTDLAGGNLAVIFDAGIGHPVAVVVLGSTYSGRFDDIQKLVNATLEAITH